MNPKISVIMPIYNCDKYLAAAVESILLQTFTDFELILVNDASTDDTLKIAQEYAKRDSRIKIINNKKNLNIAGSLNKGIEAAKAKIIARMDGDDISLPTRFQKQYELLTIREDVAVVGCNMLIMDSEGHEYDKRAYASDSFTLKKNIFRYSPFAHPTVMYRKSAVKECGGYNPQYSPTEDLDLWVRIGSKYEFANIPEYLFKYRVFKQSSSHKKLRDVEFKVMKIRWNAYKNYNYRVRLFDILYNFGQLVTIYLMPIKLRYAVFNFFRNETFKAKLINSFQKNN